MTARSGVPVLGLAALLSSCAAAGRIEGGTFHSPNGYTLTLPGPQWRVERGGDAELELKRAVPPGGMLADATCGGADMRRPPGVLARHLTFGLAHPAVLESDTRSLGGRPAARRVVTGEADGAAVTVEAVVVRSGACVHDFLYVAPSADFESGRADFRALIESLAADGRRADRGSPR